MADPIELPAMNAAQKQSWHTLMELYESISSDWALIGGQLVHLHCAERGATPTRPTDDIDTVVDIRASPTILERFTSALKDLGFTPDTSGEGAQHRWRRDHAQIDVLIPEGSANAQPRSRAPAEPRPFPRPAPPRPSTVVSPYWCWQRDASAPCCARTSSEHWWARQPLEPRFRRIAPAHATAPTSWSCPASSRLAISGSRS